HPDLAYPLGGIADTSLHLDRPADALAVLVLALSACSKQPEKAKAAPAADASTFTTVDQRVSYGIGYNVAAGLAREGIVQVDQEALKAGMTDGLNKAATRVPEAELEAAFKTVRDRATATMAAAAETQAKASAEFLEKNKARAGVKVTASGLQYEVLKSGFGPKPKTTNTVKVHYHGTLANGTVFDSSVQRNEPIEFPLTQVIPGWVEALQLMSVGDKWKLTIPPAIGYGARGKGSIPPNAVLIFEVELLEIK
ncbi:MAG TPA: FKBP-type peptidyl-prolyl cis-trans isomerase, partial [Lacunisphaera sp.]|nr:FKBP-type peptidyl-prolyl cis-trans isomerase [Lacunisphaera sp.]